jgi:hypothetical protein
VVPPNELSINQVKPRLKPVCSRLHQLLVVSVSNRWQVLFAEAAPERRRVMDYAILSKEDPRKNNFKDEKQEEQTSQLAILVSSLKS